MPTMNSDDPPSSERRARCRARATICPTILSLALLAVLSGPVAAVGVPVPAAQHDHDHDAEARRLAEALELTRGSVLADVGAGDGEWTVRLARHLGEGGYLFATEVEPLRLVDLRDRFLERKLDDVTIVLGHDTDAGLPPACCDAIFLRLVYHHFKDPAAMNASLLEALVPGGRLAIVETEGGGGEPPPGVPDDRNGHGLPVEILVQEVTEAGFEVVEVDESFGGRHLLVVVRRPDGPPSGRR